MDTDMTPSIVTVLGEVVVFGISNGLIVSGLMGLID